MTIFIRVKRKKTTYFLELEPTDTILEAKQKLQALSDVPVDKQRLVLMRDRPTILQEAKSLAEQKVENDAVVALTLKQKGPRNEETGIEPEFWEEVNIHEPEDPTSVFFKQL